MIKILILGATGKLGSRVFKKLLPIKNYQIGVLLRNNQQLPFHLDPDTEVKIFNGEILNSGSIAESINWADIVVNCIGKVSYKKKDKEMIYTANFIIVKNILEACIKYNKKLIHTSSSAIYGFSSKALAFNESDVISTPVSNVKSMYFRSKFESDKLVISADISKIVLRPSSFVVKEKSTLKLLYSVIKKGVFPVLGGGASFVLIDDVANAFLKAIELIHTSNKVSFAFNLGGNNLSFKELLLFFKKQENKRCIKVPYPALLLIGYISDYILDPLSKGIGITSESVKISNRFNYIDSQQANKMLDYKISSFENTINEIM